LDICKVILAIASPSNNAAYLTFSISERRLAVKEESPDSAMSSRKRDIH
jgi:hypothetical protein